MSNNIKNNGDLLEAKRKKKQDIIIIIVGLVVGIIISLGIIANRETSYSIKTNNGYVTIDVKAGKVKSAISQLQQEGLEVGTYQAVAFRGNEVLGIRLLAWDKNHYTGSYYVYTVNLETGNAIPLNNNSYSMALGTKGATELLAFDMGQSYNSNYGILDI